MAWNCPKIPVCVTIYQYLIKLNPNLSSYDLTAFILSFTSTIYIKYVGLNNSGHLEVVVHACDQHTSTAETTAAVDNVPLFHIFFISFLFYMNWLL